MAREDRPVRGSLETCAEHAARRRRGVGWRVRALVALAALAAPGGRARAIELLPTPPPVAAVEEHGDPSPAPARVPAAVVPEAAPTGDSGTAPAMTASWAESLRLESAARDFAVKIGGRVQVDSTAFTVGPGPAQAPGDAGLDPSISGAVNFRRARLRVEGRMYEVYDWAAEYDFVNQLNVNNEVFPTERDLGPATAITDLWLQVRELPWLGIVRVGNQKDPFGYEHLTSSRWLNFMERSYSFDAFEGAFNNGFLPGIQLLNASADVPLAWYLGQFKNTTNPFGYSNTDGGSMTVGRLVYLPVFEDEGRRLVHLGVAGRTMEPQRRQLGYDPLTGQSLGPTVPTVRFRSRGDIRNGPPGPVNSIYADAGLLIGSWQNMLGLEFVGNRGPWSWQSEYFGSWLYDARTPSLAGDGFQNNPGIAGRQPPPGTRLGTVFYQGGYAEVLYFLTGESRTYSRLESRFDRPIPRDNFYAYRDPRGRTRVSEGAWQVGLRYNYLCLDDGEVNGGVLNGVTLGLNWLLNPNARVYLNYDYTYRQFVNTLGDDGSGGIHGFGTRLAFDF